MINHKAWEPKENLNSVHMALFEHACVSVHRGRGSFAVSINYTEEGQSVGGPYTVLSLNNCLMEHMSVYGRVTSCSRTQSPKRTNCSLGMLPICARPCIPKRKTEPRERARVCWRMSQAAGEEGATEAEIVKGADTLEM